MPFFENAAYFFDGPVRDYRTADDWYGPEYSYRLRGNGVATCGNVIECIDALAHHPDAPELRALIIGKWCEYGECSDAAIIEALIRHRDRFCGLVAIFLGDITSEETRTSWIRHGDLSPLLLAYPKLEVLRVRGGQGLRFSDLESHTSLRALVVETSGMPRNVLGDLCGCRLPSLVHLELWLGAKNGGWDGSLDDLRPLFEGSLFRSLKYLGLRNSEMVDEIAWEIVNKPVLHMLETLDLSNGNLSDHGGRAMWGINWDSPLKQLILNHHYMSPDVVRTLQMELRCKVLAGDARTANDRPRHIFASE